MRCTIGNGRYQAQVDSLGAELKSLVTIADGKEYIWSGDARWWGGTAPILFPIVGGLKEGKYRFGGREYELPQHGFARKSGFTLHAQSRDTISFRLVSSDATRRVYPFEFALTATFRVDGAGLGVEYAVQNVGKGPMYFSIGSHPAFQLPFAGGTIENYYLHFSDPETVHRHFFAEGLCLDETAPVFENSRQISLTRSTFDQGPIILKGPNSRHVVIMNSKNPRRLIVSTGDAPYLGIWSKPAGAPFLCIEPWFGVPDDPGTDGRIETKEGIQHLKAGAVFHAGYRVEIV